MKRPIAFFGSALALTVTAVTCTFAGAPSAWAAPVARVGVATFAVAKMTCATCPITVKKAMSAVHGVRSVKVDFATKTASVAFDPSLTNAAAIAAASTNAGYPATIKG